MEKKKQIEQLVKQLNKWSKYYYLHNKSLVSDEVYDAALLQLKKLEKEAPELVHPDSPTLTVGFKVDENKFQKQKHAIAKLSLDNAFNENDMKTFFTQIEKQVIKPSYICEYKIDGVSLSVIYKEGRLFKALTRGDGKIGEDVTHTAKYISNLPLMLKFKDNITINGEVYFSLSSFKKLNKKLTTANKKPYKNPRNAVSGLLRQLSGDELHKAQVQVAFYDIDEKQQLGLNNQVELFEFLKKFQLPYIENWRKTTKEETLLTIKQMLKEEKIVDFQIDGIVVKVNNFLDRMEIGTTSKFPRWAIAYKKPAEIVTTIIKKIFITIGRTGRATYNAKLEPVLLSGSLVQYATLHNYEWLAKKDIRNNDLVYLHKAGEIIPEVIKVDLNHRKKNTVKFPMIKTCPHCNENLVVLEEEVDQYCVNDNCPEIKKRKLVHFASTNAMQLKTISEETITKLYEKKWLLNINDFFTLNLYFEDWIKMPGFNKKSVHNILAEIARIKRNTDLNRLLFGFGIKHIGKVTAQKIIQRAETWKNLKHIKFVDLIEFQDIGEKSAQEFHNFFHDKKNLRLINACELHLNFNTQKIKKTTQLFKGIKFVITGVLSKPRKHYEELIIKNGGNCSAAVSRNTHFLLAGEHAGSKKQKARELKIKIIDEEYFFNLLKGKELITFSHKTSYRKKETSQKQQKMSAKQDQAKMIIKEIEKTLRFEISEKMQVKILDEFRWLKNQFNQLSDKEYDKVEIMSYPNIKYKALLIEEKEVKHLTIKDFQKNIQKEHLNKSGPFVYYFLWKDRIKKWK